jgi:hypothetical protein
MEEKTKDHNHDLLFLFLGLLNLVSICIGLSIGDYCGGKREYKKGTYDGLTKGRMIARDDFEHEAVDIGFAEYTIMSQKNPCICFSWKYKLLDKGSKNETHL